MPSPTVKKKNNMVNIYVLRNCCNPFGYFQLHAARILSESIAAYLKPLLRANVPMRIEEHSHAVINANWPALLRTYPHFFDRISSASSQFHFPKNAAHAKFDYGPIEMHVIFESTENITQKCGNGAPLRWAEKPPYP